MDAQLLKEFLSLNHEVRGIEYKGHGKRDDKSFASKVVRAMLSMANKIDGGYVIVGIRDHDLHVEGLSTEEVQSWNHNDLSDTISNYADPSIIFRSAIIQYEAKNILIIKVDEFPEIPIICKKDYPGALRKGACYVRSNSKPETSEIPTQEEMRDLINLGVKKGVKKFIDQMEYAGIKFEVQTIKASSENYQKERGDF